MKTKRLLKFADIKAEVLESYNVAQVATVTLDNVEFVEGLISKIDFGKHTFKDGADILFIKLYMGNINVATVATTDNYVIERDDGKYPSFWIRKAEEFDY
ncbi:hypothetical protein [Haloimpatiens lingqiaonensis]|uniref:hypothetical protein n=1 Tax=Haloimpatiens lingqiaonensis TaxID=1380675 RepID=UPI0010FE9EE9|nr:hypothetical protein [Haloimpatiens lingqiaonensis]